MPASFISSLAEHIKQHYDLREKELTVVFPNKRAAFYLRSRFKELIDQDIWLPQMLSIQEAMTQWSGIRLIDSVDMMFELVAIDAEHFHHHNSISVFGNMATQMADDFNEIDQYEADADRLFSYIYDVKKIGVWELDSQVTEKERQYLEFYARLKTYYDLLRERLAQQGKGYYGMITRHLATLPEEELLQRIGNRTVLFAGFNALTPTEQRIIDTLYRNGQAEVIWDFDRYYVEDTQNEAGYFARSYSKNNIPWKPTVFSDHLLHDPKEIHLVGVKGKTIQAKALQSLLQVEHEADAAVILADENLIIPVLNGIPESPLFPSVKVSMGYPMRQASLNHFVYAFFTLHLKGRKVGQRGWYLWPILHILDLELVKVVFSREETKQLGRYKEMIAKTTRFIFKKDDFDSCCESDDLRRFMTLLLGADDLSQPITPQQLLDHLTELLAFIANKIVQDDTRSNLFLLNQVSETGKAVNRLRDIMERHHDYIESLSDLETLYRLVTSSLSVKLNSTTTEGLQIMGLLEARNLDFDTFYMVGVNEGVLPIEKSVGSFIPNEIRKAFRLPDYREKQAVYAYHFYRQLQSAKRVYYLYNTNGSGLGGEPSRFLLQIKYELARKNPHIKLFEESFANQTETTTFPERLIANKNEVVMKALIKKVETHDPEKALAPSSLSTYIQCPLLFFLKYVLRIQENSLNEETQSNVIGTIVHDTLETMYRDHLNTLIDKEVFNRVVKPSEKRSREAVIAGMFSQGIPDVGYNYLNELTIERLLRNYLNFEEKQLSNDNLIVKHIEHRLHSYLTVNGKSYLIAGKADRIDSFKGIIRIVDYKTGKVNDRDVSVPRDIETLTDIPEKAMQLLIYKYLYLKEHPELQPNDVTACLFALRSQKPLVELQVNNEALEADFMGEMERILSEIISQMTDPSIPFAQPDNCKICNYCAFRDLCLNTATGV